jgi:hypothetical protein
MREVYIEYSSGVWLVKYTARKKGGRHLAANFDGYTTTFEKVVDWVRSQPKLVLLETDAVTYEGGHPI